MITASRLYELGVGETFHIPVFGKRGPVAVLRLRIKQFVREDGENRVICECERGGKTEEVIFIINEVENRLHQTSTKASA